MRTGALALFGREDEDVHAIRTVRAKNDRLFDVAGPRWSGVDKIRHFSVRLPTIIERVAADPAVHGHAPNAGDSFALSVDPPAQVGWALPDPKRVSTIGPKDTGFVVFIGIPVAIGCTLVKGQLAAAAPIGHVCGRARRSPRRSADQLASIVIGVKLPGDQQLPMIVHAKNALGLDLRFVQSRQKQGSQNGDDRDDNQQFDQGKSQPGLRGRNLV